MSRAFQGLSEIFKNYGHLQINVPVSCSLGIRSIAQPDRGVCKWLLLTNDTRNSPFEGRISQNARAFLFISSIASLMMEAITTSKKFTAKGAVIKNLHFAAVWIEHKLLS